MKKRILVTGCTGLVGHGICLNLLSQGYEVWGTSRNLIQSNHPLFHPVILDLGENQSIEAFKQVMRKVDIIIHNAALIPGTSEENTWEDYFRINFEATRQLLINSSECNIKQFIFISGSPFSLLDNTQAPLLENSPFLPLNDYAISKVMAEIVCLKANHTGANKVCILRFPAPFGYLGKSEAVLPRFIKKVKKGEPITLWGKGGRQQIFTFVEDIGRACVNAIEAEAKGVFHISGPEVTSMKQLAEMVIKTFPRSASDIVYENVPDPQEERKISISIEKSHRELNFEPAFTVFEGLSRIASADKKVFFFK